jgi:multiple sugar transport system permease protein
MAEKAASIPLAQTRQNRQNAPVRWGDITSFILLTIGAIVMILPLVWMFSTSLRLAADSFKLPPVWIPTELRIENYGSVFRSTVPFVNLFLNSLKITLAVTVGQLITCSLAGFAFARLRFPGRNFLFVFLLASLMVPGQVTVIPIFLLMRSLNLIDNHLSIILPGLISAFGVFLMRQFFLTLPQDLLDAAKVDGAGPWRIFLGIALPLAAPSLAALGIITFNATWNAYFYPLIFLNSRENMTLPQGIALLRGSMNSGNPSVVMAAVTMAIIPVLFVFIIAQRWIVQALTQTGLKG